MRDLSPAAELRRLRLLEKQVKRVLGARRHERWKLEDELDSLASALIGERKTPDHLWPAEERPWPAR